MKIDFDVIRELLAVFSQTDITELTIESGEEKITVKKSPPVITQAPHTTTIELPHAHMSAAHEMHAMHESSTAHSTSASTKVEEEPNSNGWVAIHSPMVGTFYRSPSPTAPPFVEIGDHIANGQTICIIEAMKLMNDLPSEVSGRITRVCVENGTTIEYGQTLFMIDPNG